MREPLQVEMGLLRINFKYLMLVIQFSSPSSKSADHKERKSSFGGSFLYYISLCCALLDARSQSCQKERSLRDLLETAGQDLDLSRKEKLTARVILRHIQREKWFQDAFPRSVVTLFFSNQWNSLLCFSPLKLKIGIPLFPLFFFRTEVERETRTRSPHPRESGSSAPLPPICRALPISP